MQLLMEQPPNTIEGFAGNYFSQRSHIILAAFNAYKNGESMVGKYQLSSCDSTKVSPDFKKSMDTLYPNLIKAFTKIGALGQEENNSSRKAKSKSRKSKRTAVIPKSELRRSARLKLKKD
ncbi:probable ubiquitin-conjugating enzyme E2 24 [Coffea eugenioides]|uniref:probable ubiquitin-conjugating enzyme E2 24 n=1 Tax=Coffea eugenioides TaxID=49369 RepID=UPI000F607548|nr:probable ubiquitin-conjugating enzyme E2 24 [Coffea eugenioides]